MEEKPNIRHIRSVRPFKKNKDDQSSDDDGVDVADLSSMPDISVVKRKEDKIYQHLLPIDNGFYDGALDGNLLREGLGTYSFNNGEEYYSGLWKDDKPCGYGYQFKGYGSTICHGDFHDGKLKEGYGKIKKDHGYEYKGTIRDDNFHGLGILSIKIANLKDMNNTSVYKDTLKIVAEWNMGQTDIVYLDEIQTYYINQHKTFCENLSSILSSKNESLRKQRQYFQILIDLEECSLDLKLLYEIGVHPQLPKKLKSSADLLHVLDNSYRNLSNYTITSDTLESYNQCVRNICEKSLQSYVLKLVSMEDLYESNCIQAKYIFDEKLSSFTKKTQLKDLYEILSFSTLVIEMIKKFVSSANKRLTYVSSSHRSDYIQSHTKLIKAIWTDYLELADRSEDENDERYHFYIACYGNLLQLSFINPSLSELESVGDPRRKLEWIIYKAMIFSLNNLKPWRAIDLNILSSYFDDNTIHEDLSIKEIGDRLIIQILKETKVEMMHFFKRNKNDLSDIFESIIVYYTNNLLHSNHSNYQSNIQEIVKMNEYFLQISETKNALIRDTLVDLQVESIKTFIKIPGSLSKYIDHFLSFNSELCRLSELFSNLFPTTINTGFDKIASEIISSIEDLFKVTLAKDRSVTTNTETSDELQSKLFALQEINNFLTNLASLKFPWFVEKSQILSFEKNLLSFSWFVGKREIPSCDKNLFKPVGLKELYHVTNIEAGRSKVSKPYRHYMLETIKDLLDIIKSMTLSDRFTSSEKIRIRAELTMVISKSFIYLSDQINYNSLRKFKEEFIAIFKYAIKDIESYEAFHSKLERVEAYFLYDRKLKEITVDQALNSFQSKNTNLSGFHLIKKAYLSYERFFGTYSYRIIHKKTLTVEYIIEHTRKIARELEFKKETIPEIIAGLSIIFSLRVSDFIEKNHENNKYVLKDKFNKNCFLKPHCIQILGLFILFNMNDENKDFPPNHLAEIVTGQGKSWALALLAGYFSLIGYQVTVSCYSEYLMERDKQSFQEYLDPFNFNDSVKYETFKSMCEEQLRIKDQKHNLRSIISDILKGESLLPVDRKENDKQKSILLIDEVDVFFSNEFGTVFSPGLRIENKFIAKIQKDIWKNVVHGKTDKNQIQKSIEKELYKVSDQDKLLSNLFKSNLLNQHLKYMIDAAVEIYHDMKNKNQLREKYRIEDKIIKTKDISGKFVSTIWYGYENSFYYLKLMYEEQNNFNEAELNEKNFGYLSIPCGLLSYSELPKTYHRIFGVSGSLQCLSDAEQSLLTYYDIQQRSCYPSFFDGSRLRFDPCYDYLIVESEEDWSEKIIIHARRHTSKNRSVLIFFYDEKQLNKFYQSYSGDLGVNPFYVTQNEIYDGQNVNSIDIEKIIKDQYAGHHGKITLLTKEFGRGVDFQAEAKVNESGGVHVIQTFFSENIKEEIQIKGRTARKDDPGSYELILYLGHLQNPESVNMKVPKFKNVTKDTPYDDIADRNKMLFTSVLQWFMFYFLINNVFGNAEDIFDMFGDTHTPVTKEAKVDKVEIKPTTTVTMKTVVDHKKNSVPSASYENQYRSTIIAYRSVLEDWTQKLPSEDAGLYRLILQLSPDDIVRLKNFAKNTKHEEILKEVHAVSTLLQRSAIRIEELIPSYSKLTWLERIQSIDGEKTVSLILIPISIGLVMLISIQAHHNFRRWLTTFFVFAFMISVFQNCLGLYMDSLAEVDATLIKTLPEHCLSYSHGFFHNIKTAIFRTVQVPHDDCVEYQKALRRLPHTYATLIKGISLTVTEFFTTPLGKMGEGISKFFGGLMLHVPLYMLLPVLFIIGYFLTLFLLTWKGYGVSAMFGLIAIQPVHPPAITNSDNALELKEEELKEWKKQNEDLQRQIKDLKKKNLALKSIETSAKIDQDSNKYKRALESEPCVVPESDNDSSDNIGD
ncbi:unnamed protein product [Adineta steineri]|uniref:Chloride channel CLIC-like protein 1 n=1 Tax=Adineta steineri TaxID=433720 RepID=A0A815LTL6_9BILA|nr:unnamed protein product [Adineta steineri]CAF3789472.1 unnamed protein product [Adineta steineri]